MAIDKFFCRGVKFLNSNFIFGLLIAILLKYLK